MRFKEYLSETVIKTNSDDLFFKCINELRQLSTGKKAESQITSTHWDVKVFLPDGRGWGVGGHRPDSKNGPYWGLTTVIPILWDSKNQGAAFWRLNTRDNPWIKKLHKKYNDDGNFGILDNAYFSLHNHEKWFEKEGRTTKVRFAKSDPRPPELVKEVEAHLLKWMDVIKKEST